MEETRQHLVRISNNEFWRENRDTHRIGKEHAKNRTQHEGNSVKCIGTERNVFVRENTECISRCAVSHGRRVQPSRTLTAGNYLEEDRQDGGPRDQLDVYGKGSIWHRMTLDRHIWKQRRCIYTTSESYGDTQL